MKTRNLSSEQDGEIIRPKRGIAFQNGFINRHQYRSSKRKRRSRNTSKEMVPEFYIGHLRYVPYYKAKRGKLKGWMKHQLKRA